MQIHLVKIRFDNSCSYKYKPFQYCCQRLKKNKNIIFTNEDFVDNDLLHEYDDIPQFCATSTETITSYEDSWDETSNYPIQYCPHCGEKIEISVTDEIDLSNAYAELEKERKETWEKCRKTDSKKKEAELEKKVRELDRKINWFYELAEYSGTEEIGATYGH